MVEVDAGEAGAGAKDNQTALRQGQTAFIGIHQVDPPHVAPGLRYLYSASAGRTLEALIAKAFELLPEPPCEEVKEGMRIADHIANALQKTYVGIVIFATRSREDMTKSLRGFHTGESALFRQALEKGG